MPFAAGLLINPSAVRLSAANGQPIHVHGEAQVEIKFPQLRRAYNWTLVIADTINPILGADFLAHFNLIVDCKYKKLIDGVTNRFVKCNSVSFVVEQININHHDVPDVVQPLLDNQKLK